MGSNGNHKLVRIPLTGLAIQAQAVQNKNPKWLTAEPFADLSWDLYWWGWRAVLRCGVHGVVIAQARMWRQLIQWGKTDWIVLIRQRRPPLYTLYSLHQAGSLFTKYHFPGDPGYTTSSIILTQQMSENITQLRESLPVRLEFPQQHWPSVYRPCLRLVCRAALSQLSSLSGPLESWRLTAWGAQNSAYTEHPASCTSVHTPTNSGSKIKYRF